MNNSMHIAQCVYWANSNIFTCCNINVKESLCHSSALTPNALLSLNL